MAKIIKTITPEQEKQIPAYIQKWVDAASTPLNKDESLKYLKNIYPERTVIFTNSFQNTFDLIGFILNLVRSEKLEYDSQLYSQLDSQLDSQLRSQLYSQLDSQLRSQLYSQLDSQLDSQLRSQLYSQPIKWTYYVSYYWYVWAGWYDYANYIGVEFDEDKRIEFSGIILNTPLLVFLGNLIFVCEKPKVLWENGVISNEYEMAIKWADGTGYYFLDGLMFEKVLWQKIVKKELTFSEMMQIENADQQAVALKFYPDAIIKENAELVNKTDRGNELFKIENRPINQLLEEPEIWFLRMICPTGRVFVEGVEPSVARQSLSSGQPADYCQAYALGLDLSQYNNLRMEG